MNNCMPFLINLSILVIDDDTYVSDTLKSFVNNHCGTCFSASNLQTALDYIESQQFDAVVCDIRLDNSYTGFDFVDSASLIDPCLTIILTTGFEADQFLPSLIQKNIYAFLSKPFQLTSLGLIILQAAKNTKNARKNLHVANTLKNKISTIQNERNKLFFNALTSLSNALEQKDEYTKDHSENVAELSNLICKQYTTNKTLIDNVTIAGKLHDIGKIGISDNILLKKESLTEQEYELIKKHAEMSYKIIKPVDTHGKISDYILHHHERWNGQGYPHKLKGKSIPTGARIIAVADTFNALTSNRPYRTSQSIQHALQILADGKLILFDPDFVDILTNIISPKNIK